ncbi:hypothetical protein ACQJ2W_000450 [Pantoea agglomerans]|uniref:hypothetical protein n=1 Tax=Enterobacter agglomerans TaxID=549 RepID=UPI003E397026
MHKRLGDGFYEQRLVREQVLKLTVTGSTLHSGQGAVALQAKQDVTLNTATERALDFSEERSERKGFLKKSSSHTITQDGSTRENGSLLSGESVTVTVPGGKDTRADDGRER